MQSADVVECKHGVDGVNGVDGEPKAELSGTEKDNTRKRNFRERWLSLKAGEVLAEFSEFVLLDAARLKQGLLFGCESVSSLQDDVDDG